MDAERLLENQTVIVTDDRITFIGPADEVPIPDGAEVIQGDGAYLMPALADMHMHIGSIGLTFAGPGQLALFLAEGVTTIRNYSALPEHLDWKEQVARGERVGPTIYNGRMLVGLPAELTSMRYVFRAIVACSPVLLGLMIWLLAWAGFRLTGNVAQFDQIMTFILPSQAVLLLIGGLAAWFKIIPLNVYLSRRFPFAVIPETAAEARRFVRDLKEAGYDFLKVYD
jgi:hypothetical protein